MRVTTFLFFLCICVSFAKNTRSQNTRISMNKNKVQLEEVLNTIESQTDYLFIYNNEVDVNQLVTVNVRDEAVSQVLADLFGHTDISYSVKEGYIILAKKGRDPVLLAQQPEGEITLSGVVIFSSDNQPAPGVTVFVEGTNIGTVTDGDGKYTLRVPVSTAEITFSFIGYNTKKIKVKDRVLFRLVSLDEASKNLEDVVVVGFGTQKKESVVGAVQAIKPTELVATSSNFTTAFAGKIAGIISTQSSGQPGADGANFWIRGISTFGYNSSPLIILDGVEIVSEMLNSIAPETIESFSVLKDATATALYGSRGANGVLIITTKNGAKSEKMNVNVRVEGNVSGPTSIQDIADGVTYKECYNEAYGSEYFSQEKIEGTRNKLNPYVFPDNDWYHLMFKDHTFNQNANISVTGGSQKIDYFLNASVHNENGILKDQSANDYDINIGLQKYAFQSNVSALITPATRVSIRMNNMLQYNYLPYYSISSLFYHTMRANPVMFPATWPKEAGDDFIRFGNAPSWDGASSDVNPLAEMCSGYTKSHLSYLTTVFNVEQDLKFIAEGLKAKFLASFYNKTYSATSRYRNPFYYTLGSYEVDDNGNYTYTTSEIGSTGTKYLSTSVSNNGYREYSLQGTLEYSRMFNKVHDVNALLVYHQKERVDNTPDADEYEVLPYREQGIAGRLTYGYNNRYLTELNFGYNGSENFAPGHRWGFFPSVAVGWNISNENFFAGMANKITLLKLRASWGKSGNDALESRFPYITTINTNQSLNFYYGPDITQAKGSTINTIGNEDATWEVSKKLDIGLEVGLYNNLTLIMDFFREKRSGIFMQRESIPASMGYTGSEPYANIGAVTNRGIDASLEYNKAFSKDFILSVRGTFTYAHNKVTAKDEAALTYPYTSEVGHPINTVYGLVADGVFRDQEDIDHSPVQDFASSVRPGDIKYIDLNGDGVVDANDETAVGYPTTPEIEYGIGPSIKYKKFDFSFYLQGITRVSIEMSDMHPFVSSSFSGFGMTQWIADGHWTESNPDIHANYPRLSATWNLNNTQTSSYWVRNGSFLRLKSAEIGYTYKKARVYVLGTNLLSFTDFKYWDPEIGSGNGLSYPLQRTYNVGFQYNF